MQNVRFDSAAERRRELIIETSLSMRPSTPYCKEMLNYCSHFHQRANQWSASSKNSPLQHQRIFLSTVDRLYKECIMGQSVLPSQSSGVFSVAMLFYHSHIRVVKCIICDKCWNYFILLAAVNVDLFFAVDGRQVIKWNTCVHLFPQ
jgi:hypothetical protein